VCGKFDKIIVHGHTPAAEAQFHSNRINVDTGAFATGRLSRLRIETNRVLRFNGTRVGAGRTTSSNGAVGAAVLYGGGICQRQSVTQHLGSTGIGEMALLAPRQSGNTMQVGVVLFDALSAAHRKSGDVSQIMPPG